MPAGVGYVGEEAHDNLVKEQIEIEQFYAGQLQTTWRNWVRWKRMYLADRDDKRKPHEKWRSNTVVPHAYSGTETAVAALSEVFLSTDPPIQTEGVGVEDEERARKIERLFAYALERNAWPLNLDIQLRDVKIQGTAAWKVTHTHRSTKVRLHSSPEQDKAFDLAIDDAVKAGAPNPPLDDPIAFEEWRNLVNTARVGNVPPMPGEPGGFQEKEIIQYRGPSYDRVSLFDLRFDPLIENVQDQPVIMQRVVKPLRWLMARTGPGADRKYDPRQVEAGVGKGAQERFSDSQKQIAGYLGLSNFDGKDPIYKDAVELLEVWRPGMDAPYLVILNRTAIINKRPDVYPYWHGMQPYVFLRNVPLAGAALGMSDFQQVEKLVHEMWTMHDLLLDATLLAVLPMFTKLREVALPDAQRQLRPGSMLEMSHPDGIKALTKFDPGLQHAFSAISSLKETHDETRATQPNVRGAASTIGRVSATESQGRLQQALQRQKQHVLRMEGEMAPLAMMSLFLWHQFEQGEMTLRVGGDELREDPFAKYDTKDFLWALNMDFRFRGATKALNRELSAQQLKDVLVTGANLRVLLPAEVRTLLKKVYEILGHKGTAAIFTQAGDQALKMASQQQQDAQAAASAAQGEANQATQVAASGAPDEIALEDEAAAAADGTEAA